MAWVLRCLGYRRPYFGDPVNEKLMKHLLGFEDKYPHRLEAEFARIVEIIADLWDTPGITRYLAEILIDTRGERHGFPDDIAREIFLLSVVYDEIHNKRCVETNGWDGEWNAARKAIEELNIRVSCSRQSSRPGEPGVTRPGAPEVQWRLNSAGRASEDFAFATTALAGADVRIDSLPQTTERKASSRWQD